MEEKFRQKGKASWKTVSTKEQNIPWPHIRLSDISHSKIVSCVRFVVLPSRESV